MPKIKFILGSRPYEIACNDGDEQRIADLAASLDVRVEEVKAGFGSTNESLILAVTALTMEDEIRTLKTNATIQAAPAPEQSQNNDDIEARISRCIAEALAPYTEKLEALALSLEVG